MPHDAQQDPAQCIDVAFRLTGDELPLDHGYGLYAALSHLAGVGPWIHASEALAVHPIRGHQIGPGRLQLTSRSRLRLRLPAAHLPQVLALSGQQIEVDGHRLRIGVPETYPLRPAAVLHAQCVTTRNGQDEARFDAEIRRQMEALGLAGEALRGQRRILRIHQKTVVGHALLLSKLTADESLRLQALGLGGRRKMGCGVFNPWRG